MFKKGQFFIIAALVIVVIIASLGIVYNSSKSNEESTVVYDFAQTAVFEGSEVVDWVEYNGNSANLEGFISKLANDYSISNPDSEFIFIFGDGKSVKWTCDTSGGSDLLGSGARYCSKTPKPGGATKSNDLYTVRFKDGDSVKYEFKNRPGMPFYVVIKRGGEVSTSESPEI
jgi:hypothetical protein